MADYNSLDTTQKKRLAREAASRHILLSNAVREYIHLTGIIHLLPDSRKEKPPYKNDGDGARPTCADTFYSLSSEQQEEFREKMPDYVEAAKIYRKAEKELLALLPKYRHPVGNSIFAEQMIFFASDGLEITLNAFTWTPFMMEVQESVPEPMRSKILDELKSLELTKGELNTAIKERDALRNTLDDAWREYQPRYKNEPINARQKRVIRTLGFSDGKRHKTFKPEKLYRDYVNLVRRENLNRVDAIDEVAKLHRITPNTAVKELHRFRASVKKRIKQRFSKDLQKDMLSYLVGLVPRQEDVDAARYNNSTSL